MFKKISEVKDFTNSIKDVVCMVEQWILKPIDESVEADMMIAIDEALFQLHNIRDYVKEKNER